MTNPYFIRRQGLARLWLVALLLLLLGLRMPGLAQNISTVAGDGTTSGTGNSTGFTLGVAVDPAGNIYVAGGNAHVVRRITPGGVYSTVAGTGTAGFSGDGGPATSATLNAPVDLAVINNNLYIVDRSNSRVRKVDLSTGIITTVAGNGTTNLTGTGIGIPQGVAADASGNVYVATGNGHIIRKITPSGVYSNFAGTGTAGYSGDGGAATSAQVDNPVDIFFSSNALYIADLNNRYIRKVDLSSNVITSVAGDGTTGTSSNGIGFPNGVSVDGAGNILVATGNGHVIRKITPGGVHSTVAGTGTAGFSGDGGPATSAQVASPIDMSALNNDIYIADRDNYRIRKVTNVVVTAPAVMTTAATAITTTGATLGGNVTADGGSTITTRGVVYSSTNTTPTIGGAGVAQNDNGTGTGAFSEPITGLSPGTTYYVQAYATNSAGTSYGGVVQFVTTPNAPTVTAPANGSLVNTATPTYSGTAQAGATITVYVDGAALSGTVTAGGSGNWSKAQLTNLSQGSHTVYATASVGSSATSATSNTNTFTVDTTPPSVAITSTAGSSGSTTTTSPIPFTITFSESVTGFVQGDLTVSGGSISGFSGSGSTYTFNVPPGGSGSTVTVNVAANVAQDGAGNGNTAASQFGITYQQPTATVASVTRLTPSPTATAQVSYRVVFSASVTGVTTSNFSTTNGGSVSGSSVASVSGSGTTYTVVVNTGTGNGTLLLNVANATGISPTVTNTPYTAGETYTITKSFAAAPTLRIQGAGSASGNSDVTAFVDEVQVLSGGTAVANALQNGSFETNNVAPSNYLYQSQGVVATPWTFGVQAGISRNNSAFGSTASNGDAIAFLQSAAGNNGSVSQNLALPTGSYQVSFRAIQRNYTSLDQRLNVFVNDVFVGSIQSNNIPTYDTFTSATFNVTAPALTATVSTTSASPTSTSPVPFSVSFSQSVGTTFTAPDVTVSGGTLTSGSFSGSGAGPYTLTVTPTGSSSTVTVSLAAGVATDANNTGNSASNSVSVQYAQPVTAAPVVTVPANNSFVSTTSPTYTGTAPASSTVTVYVDNTSIGTTAASTSGNWTLTQPTALSQGNHTVYATAQTSGSTVSANSNTNTFTVDSQRPSVVLSSTTVTSGGTTTTSPVAFTATFSESVTGFVASDLSVTGGTISGFSGSGTTYTFNVTPSGAGTVTVNIAANVTQDAAGNGNTAASQYSLTYQLPPVTVASVTRLTPSPTATTSVSYRVVFSGSVSGLTLSNFSLTTSGLSGAAISTLSGSNMTYTVTVNTGSGDGTLRLDVANATGVTPTISNVPYTNGEQYTITKSFAAAPTLRIQGAGSASGNSDVTAFVDEVQVLSGGSTFANGLQNGSFETNNVQSSNYLYQSQGVAAAPWSFGPQAGISRNNSAFGSTASNGDAVAFLQSAAGNNGSVSQNLALPTGSYQVRFRGLQRNYTSLDQRLNVFVNDVFVGSIQPNNIPTYDTFTSATFSVTVPDLTATVSTTSASPTSTSPIPFSVSFSQSVGTTFTASDVTVTGGTLTSGSFSGSGAGPYTFTVTPSGAGTVTVSVAANLANDANNTGNTASNSVSVQYQAPTIAVAPASLPGGTQGTAYSQALSASGGSGTYTYALSGTPPPGLNLSGSTLAGTPTASGTFSFRITATDNSAAPGPYSGSRDYTVSIATQPVTAAPTVATPANGSQVGTATPTYSGTAPATSTVTVYVDGTSIGTVTATPGGVWSLAQPATLAEGSHTVRATAQAGGSTVSASSNSNTFIVDTVRPTVVISSSTGASGSATSTSPFAFTITFSESVTGFVQGDLTVTGGTISGFSGSGTTYTFSVTPSGSSSTVAVNVAANVAQDQAGNGNTAAASAYTLTFQAPTITVAPATLPGGTVGVAYSQAFTAAGGSSPYSYAISAGALPAGLTLASNGTLAGTPMASGTFTFTVTATDASAAPGPYSGSHTYSLTINAPAITVAPATLPGGTVATAYSQTITASGGMAPYTYAVTAGALPAGLTLSTSGTLSGAPTAGGSFTFTVAATDAAGFTGTRGYTLTIAAPTVVVAPTSLPNGATGVAYSQTITASGGTAPYSYAITAGALPAGLTLASSGTLAGRPTAGGTFTFTVTATDASTGSGPYGGSRSYSVTITTSSVAWTGAVSTDWFTAGNWSPNQVPDATIDATIPTSPSGNRFPVIASGAASARNLTLNSNATLTHTGGTLSVAANLTNNGNFRPTGGTVTLGETAQSNILGSGSTGFWNLTVGASGAQQSTSASTSVQRLLTLNGSFATNGNPFTLASSASGTALVVNNGSNAVSGNVTVQRYIDPSLNPNLGYRHVATAVSGQQVSSLATGSFSPVVNPAYNTSATPNLVRPFPTVYGYDQSRLATTTNNLTSFDKGWYSPSASADPLSVGQGYTVLIGGGQTWSFTGPLNNGDLSLKLARNSGATAGDAGLHLVGNPYPSPLDWSQLTDADRSNLDGVMYVFRSNDPSNPYTGAYGFYNNGLGTISPVLPQGQGFFVRVTPGQTLGTLTLRNSHRPTTYANPAYQRTGVETRPLVRLSLQGAGTPDADEAFVYFEAGAGSGYEPRYDAEKLANPSGLNLSTSLSATQRLSIDGRAPLGTTQLVVPLAVGVPAPGSYTLKAAQLLNLANTPTYLRDLQTGAVVDLARQASYQFTVGNASALLTSRFELVFSPQQPLATAAAALAQQVGLYPNPAKGSAFVELPASLGRQAVTATLVDAVGREVRTVSLPAQGAVAHSLDLRELPTGVYMLRLSTSAGLLVKKLTVE